MPKVDLSILIPTRNEMFLKKTIENILDNIQGNTEVIAVADGQWPDPPLEDNPKVTLIYKSAAIGQRAATNEAARYSRAKWIMKCDAHCAFDKGFDVKLMGHCDKQFTLVPRMYNLHAFDWVCSKCGNRRYQGPTPTSCPNCDNKTDFKRDILWKEKRNPQSDAFRFDRELHFQYWSEFKSRPEGKKEPLAPTMSLLGACWMMQRERYWELGGMDEEHGSWGQMGTEIACKSWLSGGELLVDKSTWFAHMFRTQGGDFGFPYPNPGIKKARKRSRELWIGGKWLKAIHDLEWLIRKFAPVPEWDEAALDAIRKKEEPVVPYVETQDAKDIVREARKTKVQGKPTKGLLYYTDNRLDPRIMEVALKNIQSCSNGHRLVSVSLAPMKLGENIVCNFNPGYLAMNKQQLEGLKRLDTDIVFMVEHDILYPPCHFDFVPPREDVFYYNLNWWKVRVKDGQALHFKAKQVSGLCAYRHILLEYFSNRVRMMESKEIGGRRHFEPGTRHWEAGYDKLTTHGFDTWYSEVPYVDIRHDGPTCSRSIFDPSGYRTKVVDWTLADEIPHWGKTKDRFDEWLNEVNAKLDKQNGT